MTQVATRFWWVRHAPVKAMIEGRIYGQRDVGCRLTDTDTQARLAAILPLETGVWVSSSLSRTKKTAHAIAAQANQQVRPLAYKELREQNFGLWQGKAWDELEEEDPSVAEFWADPAGHCPPEGESFVNVCKRVQHCVDHLVKSYQGQDVICVAHGGTIRAALAQALDLSPAIALRFGCAPYSLTKITQYTAHEGQEASWAVEQVNQLYGFD